MAQHSLLAVVGLALAWTQSVMAAGGGKAAAAPTKEELESIERNVDFTFVSLSLPLSSPS